MCSVATDWADCVQTGSSVPLSHSMVKTQLAFQTFLPQIYSISYLGSGTPHSKLEVKVPRIVTCKCMWNLFSTFEAESSSGAALRNHLVISPQVHPLFLSAKQVGSGFHFYSLWYDLARNRTHNLPDTLPLGHWVSSEPKEYKLILARTIL